jgi:CRP-like cAMP-binding protein
VPSTILAASASLPEVSVAAGEALITEGEHQPRLFVLVRGRLEVSRDGVPFSSIDEPGAIFGEIAALLGGPATATVRTRDDSVLRVCDDAVGFLTDHPEVSLAVATTLARRLDALTRYLADLREQYADRDDHLGLVDVVLESISHRQGASPDPGSDREHESPY